MKNKVIILLTIMLIITSCPVFGAGETSLSGTIEGLNFKDNIITLLDYKGRTHEIKVLPTTTLQIEGLKKKLVDFYFGQEIEVAMRNNTAIKVVGFTEDDPELDGYIMAGSRFKRGQVLFISQNQIEIKGIQGREKYRITPNTSLFKNGRVINLFQIKEGDNVVLTFDSIYTSEVDTIKVEDEEKHISGILRGKIELVDERNKEVLIKSPYIYKEGKWETYSDHVVKLKVSEGNLYNGGDKISLKKLKNFKDKEAYIAFDESFGKITVSKLNVKNGLAQGYQSKVRSIEYGTGKMVVDNNLIFFNDGTIVIKDNRLVDSLNIDRNKDVLVTADNVKGNKNANLVSISSTTVLDDRIDGSKILVYRGKIEDIYEYEVKIGKINYRLDYLMLNDYKWKEIKDSERFTLSEDTLIYDSQLKETITANQFISSRFINYTDIKNQTLRDRLKNNFYKNKTAYFVVRESEYGKELLALNITPHIQEYRQNVNLNYSTLGEIKAIDYDRGTLTLSKVKNYNTLNNRWENANDETIDINKSVILLNDIPIPRDKIYTLRQGAKVYVLKNKTSSIDDGYVLLIED
ncbi:hypothetical protein KQI42_03130 [Tissierella sp. MSJ-40]|uniref:Organic solvent tolerance-like N-terminal domain-containing protein n=1 Tax=Tissierella simiarum TaxID=2841534 RepID=A0ABS6E329_9FIRM|nr:hypothetical protein [Tissierella simiarum]MBU5436986.1 hypothetical protein [Tissierella simiarum]